MDLMDSLTTRVRDRLTKARESIPPYTGRSDFLRSLESLGYQELEHLGPFLNAFNGIQIEVQLFDDRLLLGDACVGVTREFPSFTSWKSLWPWRKPVSLWPADQCFLMNQLQANVAPIGISVPSRWSRQHYADSVYYLVSDGRAVYCDHNWAVMRGFGTFSDLMEHLLFSEANYEETILDNDFTSPLIGRLGLGF